MAQTFPTTALAIYNVIKGLSDTNAISLGAYILNSPAPSGGQTALSILSPGEELPAVKKVEGVECIIQDTGDFVKNEYITNDPARLSISWSVFLVAWDGATGADMQAIAQAICAKFYGSEAIQTVATDKGLGAKVQTKLIIKSDMPII